MTFLFLLSTWRLGPFYFHSIVNVSTLFVITPILPCSKPKKTKKSANLLSSQRGSWLCAWWALPGLFAFFCWTGWSDWWWYWWWLQCILLTNKRTFLRDMSTWYFVSFVSFVSLPCLALLWTSSLNISLSPSCPSSHPPHQPVGQKKQSSNPPSPCNSQF